MDGVLFDEKTRQFFVHRRVVQATDSDRFPYVTSVIEYLFPDYIFYRCSRCGYWGVSRFSDPPHCKGLLSKKKPRGFEAPRADSLRDSAFHEPKKTLALGR